MQHLKKYVKKIKNMQNTQKYAFPRKLVDIDTKFGEI